MNFSWLGITTAFEHSAALSMKAAVPQIAQTNAYCLGVISLKNLSSPEEAWEVQGGHPASS